MPTEDLYTGIAVTGMFIIGVVLAMVKMPRTQRKIIAKRFRAENWEKEFFNSRRRLRSKSHL